MSKRCPKCQEVKEASAFYASKQLKSGLSSWCKVCHSEQHKKASAAYYEANKEASKAASAKRYQANKKVRKSQARLRKINSYWPHLSPEEAFEAYKTLLVKQNFSCNICEMPQTELNYSLAVDHCHTTNIVRGLLCRRCNSGLGFFEDRADLVKRAAQHIEGMT